MDIFTFAMEKEESAEQKYRSLAEQVSAPGMKNIFNRLADMERRHQEVVQSMRDQAETELQADSLDNVRTMFHQLAADKDQFLGDQQRQLDIYKSARQLEQESVDLYRQQAEESDNEEHREIFMRLMEQEKMHYIIMDNMIEFVMQPETWCENAEFSHIIDKYRGTDYYPGMMEYDI